MKTHGVKIHEDVIQRFNSMVESGEIDGMTAGRIEAEIFQPKVGLVVNRVITNAGHTLGEVMMRATDKMLQKARKEGLIKYDRKAKVWNVVKEGKE